MIARDGGDVMVILMKCKTTRFKNLSRDLY